MNIDIKKLKEDLIDYFGTAMYNASPLAMIELVKIEKASNQEIIQIAIDNNFDLNEYVINTKSR